MILGLEPTDKGKIVTGETVVFGYYNQELADYCQEIGFERLLLVDYNTKEDAENDTWKNRFVMNPYISMEQQLACLLKGSYF